jgi:ABC-type uncharacterized transport system permease subunit
MTHTLLAIAAIACYLGAAILVALRLFRPGGIAGDGTWVPRRELALSLGFAGLALHSWLLWDGIFSHSALNLGFFNALALTSWTVVTLLLVSSLTKPVENLGLILLPVAALTLGLEARYGELPFLGHAAAWPLKVHVLLSMLSYSLLTLAAVQAILLAVQDHHLRIRQPGGFVRGLPPLETMESLLFEMIAAGFVLLTLALLSGFAFLEDMFAQHLVHKTVLSTLGWLVFGGLLFGRFRHGWRGRTAIVWTLSGFVILVLAYFGSKAVLQLVLQRPPL